MKTRYPNVTIARDRHGKLRARYRKAGVGSVYLNTLPDQPGFASELNAAIVGLGGPIHVRHKPGSVSDLLSRYYRSADFVARGGEDNRRARRGILESFREEFGKDQITDFTFEHIEAILLQRMEKRRLPSGRTIGGPVAATNLRKQLCRLFAFAKRLRWIESNPVEEAHRVGVDRIKGFHTWSEPEIAQYQAHHPIGTKARLALEIILWTGQRRGDVTRFGSKHIVNGKISYRASKTAADLWLPISRDLRRSISATPAIGITTFMVTDYGKPFTKDGFGNRFREWCDEAGLPHCTAHGLRKAIARRMAQMRLSDEEMMAVGGWRDSKQVRTYTEAVDQAALATGAIQQIEDAYSTNEGDNFV